MSKKTITGGQSLPFPAKPSGSTAGRTMQESVYNPLPEERRLPEDAPNIHGAESCCRWQPDQRDKTRARPVHQ